MRVKNYEEWLQAVNAEHRKLSEVSHYLNQGGINRLRAFEALCNLSDFCSTPKELLAWVDGKEDLDEQDVAFLESDHIKSAISALRRIAKKVEQ